MKRLPAMAPTSIRSHSSCLITSSRADSISLRGSVCGEPELRLFAEADIERARLSLQRSADSQLYDKLSRASRFGCRKQFPQPFLDSEAYRHPDAADRQ